MIRLAWWIHLGLVLVTCLAYVSPYVDPAQAWPASIAALALPALLATQIVFAIGWVLLRRSHWWLSVAAFALGYGQLGHVLPVSGLVTGDAELVSADRLLRVTTYNMLGGGSIYDKSREAFRQNLQRFRRQLAEDTDLLVLQESPKYAYVRRGLDSTLSSAGLRHRYNPTDLTLSLHSRHPILAAEVIDQRNGSNGILSVLLHTPTEDTVQVLVAHLASNAVRLDASDVLRDAARDGRRAFGRVRGVASRYRQAAAARVAQVEPVLDAVARSRRPVLLLGDLNDVPLSRTLAKLRGSGLVDAWEQRGWGFGVTYPDAIPGLRIDYVLHSPNIQTESVQILDAGFSDHRPLRAVLHLPSKAVAVSSDTVRVGSEDSEQFSMKVVEPKQ